MQNKTRNLVVLLSILVALGALLLAALPALAAEETVASQALAQGGPRGGRGPCTGFVDENGDGIYDNCPMQGARFVDEDGDGICDNCPMQGARFVDENGDGICDNYGAFGGMMGGFRGGNGRNQGRMGGQGWRR